LGHARSSELVATHAPLDDEQIKRDAIENDEEHHRGNFNAFDLVYTVQGALAGPDMSTDIIGTLLYRTFFGFQLQLGDRSMGATIA
ncbi:hypothetical protein AB9F42_34890, partial [Rhizobium leguminosarum]